MKIDREHLYMRGDSIQDSWWGGGLSMTRLDWVEDSTQLVWIFCIKFDAWKNIENYTVLEENSVKKKTMLIERVRA